MPNSIEPASRSRAPMSNPPKQKGTRWESALERTALVVVQKSVRGFREVDAVRYCKRPVYFK
jgi:hypothetical protein